MTRVELQKMMEDAQITSTIAELKTYLAETDYKAIKFAEGVMSAEDYAPIKAERQRIRERINELEDELANR